MKRLYYSSFLPGLEKPMTRLLSKESGVSVEQVLRGGALYRSVKTPALPFVHQSFLVLARLKSAKTPDEALRLLLSGGTWLDNLPFEEMEGKRFRITVSDGEKKIPAGMRYVDQLERAIGEHTGLRVNRERPNVELWVLLRPEQTLFLWRLSQAPRTEGRLRPDLVHAIASNLGYNQQSAAVLGMGEDSVALALRQRGARRVTLISTDEAAIRRVARGQGIHAALAGAEHTGLEAKSQEAVYLHAIPPHGHGMTLDLRAALYEAGRISTSGGRLVVSAPAVMDDVVRRNRGWRELEQCVCMLSGQAVSVWTLEAAPEREDEG